MSDLSKRVLRALEHAPASCADLTEFRLAREVESIECKLHDAEQARDDAMIRAAEDQDEHSAQRANLARKLAECERERNMARANWEGHCESLERDLTAARAERDELENRLTSAGASIIRAGLDLRMVTEERDAARAKLAEVTEQRDAIQALVLDPPTERAVVEAQKLMIDGLTRERDEARAKLAECEREPSCSPCRDSAEEAARLARTCLMDIAEAHTGESTQALVARAYQTHCSLRSRLATVEKERDALRARVAEAERESAMRLDTAQDVLRREYAALARLAELKRDADALRAQLARAEAVVGAVRVMEREHTCDEVIHPLCWRAVADALRAHDAPGAESSEPLALAWGTHRDALGQMVRETWIAWAMIQPNPKPSWLVPWERLAESDREVDRLIGEALFRHGQQHTDSSVGVAATAEDGHEARAQNPQPAEPPSDPATGTTRREPPESASIGASTGAVIDSGGASGAAQAVVPSHVPEGPGVNRERSYQGEAPRACPGADDRVAKHEPEPKPAGSYITRAELDAALDERDARPLPLSQRLALFEELAEACEAAAPRVRAICGQDTLFNVRKDLEVRWNPSLGELARSRGYGSKHRCTVCGCFWRLNPPSAVQPEGSWSLWDAQQKPGECCDNAPMGSQIVPVADASTGIGCEFTADKVWSAILYRAPIAPSSELRVLRAEYDAAIRRAALEEAARVCDERAARRRDLYVNDALAQANEGAARAIRALASAGKEET